MTASVIIPTYQGAQKIVPLVRALEIQTCLDFEVIVVIDGSTDNTAKVLAGLNASVASFHVIEQENRGRAAARNAGAKAARGQLLIFYDDDVEPNADSVARHLDFYNNRTDVLMVGGAPQHPDYARRDFGRYRVFLGCKWTAGFADDVTRLSEKNLFATAANCSISKKIFDRFHGFDEDLKDAEDRDLALRLYSQEVPVIFDRKNIVMHRETVTCRSYIRRLRQYSAANQIVDSRHSNLTKPASVPYGLKKVGYRFFALSLWVNLIDNTNVFSLLPRKLRYRCYDAITHALSQVFPHVAV